MKLSKKGKRIIFILLASFLLLLIIFALFSACDRSDRAKFKREYESYNNKDAGNGNKYQKLKIKNSKKIKYIDKNEVLNILNGKTGIIYFGSPTCPWSRSIVPTLLKQIDSSTIQQLYYYDITDDRDSYELKNNKVEQTKEKTLEYSKMLSILNDYLDDYIITDEDGFEYEVGEKRINTPLIVTVVNGYIQNVHQGSVELEENQTPYDKLTDNQIKELEVIFNNLIDTITVNE